MASDKLRYPGRLGNRITKREQEAAAASAALELFELFDRYGISREDRQRLLKNAALLAQPVSRVGRPRKFKEGVSLAVNLGIPQSRRRPGRKREWTDEKYRKLVIRVRDHCMTHGLKGHGAVTKALTEMIKNYAGKHNLSKLMTLGGNLKNLQKRHSDGKKKFPELG